ncbi:MAG: DNA gyrase inhibitor YacG [Nitrospirota bacterium]|nr:DNA gyrase inhibitor YacG [Nitrospirota bacterium]MDH5586003.1 DNA gyrase inhibitor YacG [Nitrospirota bacterium]
MGKSTHTCPTCHKAVSWEGNVFRPFCSDRCRLVDLQGWFDERYRIPQDDSSDQDDLLESPSDGERDSDHV